MAWHKSNPVSQRLASVPDIGPIIATAIARHGGRTERLPQWARVRGLAGPGATAEFHRWQTSPGRISKRGNPYLRRLLINGASANLLRSMPIRG